MEIESHLVLFGEVLLGEREMALMRVTRHWIILSFAYVSVVTVLMANAKTHELEL